MNLLIDSDTRIHMSFKENITVKFRITLHELTVEVAEDLKAIEVVAFSLGCLPETCTINVLQKALYTWPKTGRQQTGTKLEVSCCRVALALKVLEGVIEATGENIH